MADPTREQKILEYLKRNGDAKIDELAKMLYVSEASIRRDLNELQKEGLVRRTHGGVVLSDKMDETSVMIRRMENSDAKAKTIATALRYQRDFKTAFIDDSSTCLMLAEKMDLKGKLIVTNGFQLASYLAKTKGVDVIVLGGTLHAASYSMMGTLTNQMLSTFRFDLCLISCTAIDEEYSYENNTDTVTLKTLAAKNSRYTVLLADSSKFTKKATFTALALSDCTAVFTDADDSIVSKCHPAARVRNK